MTVRYKAAFLISSAAKKELKDEGWFFSTEERVPLTVQISLLNMFSLEKREEYDGVSVYLGDGMKVNVIRDEAGLIEQIYFQLFERTENEMRALLCGEAFEGLEFFVPAKPAGKVQILKVDPHQKAYVYPHVFDDSIPVLLVSRPEGDWCFLCGVVHSDTTAPIGRDRTGSRAQPAVPAPYPAHVLSPPAPTTCLESWPRSRQFHRCRSIPCSEITRPPINT